MESDIKHYLVICMIKFAIGLIILLVKKRGITDSITYNFAKIKIDSYNS